MAGLYFEEFYEGQVFEHELRKTLTESDNMMFSTMTLNPQPLHIDRHFSEQTEWGQPLMNSLLTLGLVIGVSVGDTTLGTTIGNLGMKDTQFPQAWITQALGLSIHGCMKPAVRNTYL